MSAFDPSSPISEGFVTAITSATDANLKGLADEIFNDGACALCSSKFRNDAYDECSQCAKDVCSSCMFDAEIDDETYCIECGLANAEHEIESKRDKISDLEAEIDDLETAQQVAEERKEKLSVLSAEKTKQKAELQPAVLKYLAFAKVSEAIKAEMEALKTLVLSASGIDLSEHI